MDRSSKTTSSLVGTRLRRSNEIKDSRELREYRFLLTKTRCEEQNRLFLAPFSNKQKDLCDGLFWRDVSNMDVRTNQAGEIFVTVDKARKNRKPWAKI